MDDLVLVCRSARLPRPEYRFYRDILLAFPQHGAAPDAAELKRLAQAHHVPLRATLARLAAHDLVQRDPTTGAIRAAYPFSGVPTMHRVLLVAGPRGEPSREVFAMCAIDALGIPLMLRRAARISSLDALTREPVQVWIAPEDAKDAEGTGWATRWGPASAVVYARLEGHEHEHDCGSEAAGTCCPITNFFTREAHAHTWAESYPHADGQVFSQAEALRHAASLFAGVLDRLAADERSTP